ncbi:phosphoribosyltransferase [Pseudomonas paraeruginosa]|uniref:phosphoribosyltransferase n=1 Tax=Pseudomonas paraeruginosa TaxID=2994495 RepID=UPI0039FC4B61
MSYPRFADRRHAGRELAARLRGLRLPRPLVLALPRGGVPVAYEIALVLAAPLDLLLVRKIGAPGHPEFALGAVVDGADPHWVVDERMMELFKPPPDWFQHELAVQLRELERRRARYCRQRPAPRIEDRDVLLVDDGMATGSSALAGLQALRRQAPRSLRLALPVASAASVARLRPLLDELVCLDTPETFRAVGDHYRDFHPLDDDEVIELLAAVPH